VTATTNAGPTTGHPLLRAFSIWSRAELLTPTLLVKEEMAKKKRRMA
jgi:hypothetical protein